MREGTFFFREFCDEKLSFKDFVKNQPRSIKFVNFIFKIKRQIEAVAYFVGGGYEKLLDWTIINLSEKEKKEKQSFHNLTFYEFIRLTMF